MKMSQSIQFLFLPSGILIGIIFLTIPAFSQMPPPGYERAMKMKQEMENKPLLDRDSVTLVDTTVIFDPSTYESETKIIVTRYSLRDYCKAYLNMNDPDILLDHQQHTIVDPKTYEDMIIRLNASGKIDTIPK